MCKEIGLWKKLERAKLVETSRLKRPGMVPRKEANNKELRRAFNFFLKLRSENPAQKKPVFSRSSLSILFLQLCIRNEPRESKTRK